MRHSSEPIKMHLWLPLGILSLLVGACVPLNINGVPNANDQETQVGYPGPGTPEATQTQSNDLVYPTQVGGEASPYENPFPTQTTKEQAAMVLAEGAKAPNHSISDFQITSESNRVNGFQSTRLILTNPLSGEKTVLGDDEGVSVPGALGMNHYAWFYWCNDCKPDAQGLFVLDFETGKQTHISGNSLDVLGSVSIAEPWVLYFTLEGAGQTILHGYNLDKSFDIVLDKSIPYTNPIGRYAVNESAAAWVGIDPSGTKYELKWMDLDSQSMLDIETASSATVTDVAVSKTLVVWQDFSWRVYDTRSLAQYALPVLPSDIKVAAITQLEVHQPIVVGSQVFWSVTIDGMQHDLSVQIK